MSSWTREDYRDALVDRYGIGRRGTNTGTDAAAITDDANFGGHRASENIGVGCAVLITSGTRDGGLSRLSTRPVLTTGVMNLDPALAGALANTDTFTVLYRPFEFDGAGQYSVHRRINEALADYEWERLLLPVTLVADGDMLASGTSDWTTSGASVAKTAASFANLGRRVLAVTDSGSGGGYARSASIPVEAGETYYLEATGSGVDASDAGSLVLYDVTNGAAITLDESVIDRIEPELLMNPNVTIPSGCEQVQIRLTCTNASDVIHWSDVIFRKNSAREFLLADRPQLVQRMGRVFATSIDTWSERGLRLSDDQNQIHAEFQQLSAGLWQLRLPAAAAGKSLWYEEYLTPAALTADSGTSTIPAEAVAAVAAEKLLFPMRRDAQWAGFYEQAARDAAGWRQKYGQHLQVTRTHQRRYPLAHV